MDSEWVNLGCKTPAQRQNAAGQGLALKGGFLKEAGLEMVPILRSALFRAGRVYAQYRKAGGSRIGVLPDFFIRAHAAVAQLPLLTRDIGRYRTYFPALKLISSDLCASCQTAWELRCSPFTALRPW